MLISIFCVISGNEFPLYGSQFGWYVLGRPLIGGFICGIILGDVAGGIQLGVAVQLVYLAVVTPGGSMPIDLSFVSYPAMAIALASNMDSGSAIALASTIGVLGSFVCQLDFTVTSFFHKMQDKAIEEVDYNKYNKAYLVYPQLLKFLIRGVPCFLAVYLGAKYVGNFIDSMPQFVQAGLLSLGAVLPAVGIATLLTQSVRKNEYILFFLVGFVGIVFMNLNILGLTIFGGALAFLYYKSSFSEGNEAPRETNFDEEVL
ncbi:hypothetical protein RV13_GL001747 [Enterococcus raffinosus]|nr:hypothetical protein RV13_GL001747 [Enterococcus raffinosus]